MKATRLLFLLLALGASAAPALAQQDATTGASAPQARPHRGQHRQQPPRQTTDTAGVVTMTRQKGVYVINTAKLGHDVRGFHGPTPLEVRIQKNKIVDVKALPNHETPKYFDQVRQQLLPRFVGQKATDTKAAEVDGVTGATFSSTAVKENLRRALDHYRNHK